VLDPAERPISDPWASNGVGVSPFLFEDENTLSKSILFLKPKKKFNSPWIKTRTKKEAT
jgi:hypothetical protein